MVAMYSAPGQRLPEVVYSDIYIYIYNIVAQAAGRSKDFDSQFIQ